MRRPIVFVLLAGFAALVAAMACFQLGAVLAKGLFPVVGAVGAAAMRLAIASAMLFAVWRRWRMRLTWREARAMKMRSRSCCRSGSRSRICEATPRSRAS